MISTNFKSWLLALLISAVGVLLAFQFSAKLPFAYAYGCDSYGYLRQAELLRTKGLSEGLQTEIKAENANFLVEIAQVAALQAIKRCPSCIPHLGPKNLVLTNSPDIGVALERRISFSPISDAPAVICSIARSISPARNCKSFIRLWGTILQESRQMF